MDFIDKAYDITLLTIKEVFVYKVPPLRSASGHRAEDWNLATPLFTGYIRIIQNNNILFIRLYNYKNASSLADNDENLVLFGECPIEVEPKGDIIQFVDAVIDSSRYYVIRLKDRNSTRTTLIGIGFRDRETSFDFKNILNEYVRYVDRMAEAEKLSNETGGKGNESSAQDISIEDLSIKAGEKIKVNIGKTTNTTKPATISNISGTKTFTLSPPPAPGSLVTPISNTSSISNDEVNQADDEWTDFA